MGDLLVKYDDDISWKLKPAKSGDIGLDLPIRIMGSKIRQNNCEHYIYLDEDPPYIEIPPRTYAELEVGIRVKLPDDSWALVTGRSSTAWKRQLFVIQGVIDSGYVGYLRNLVYNPNEVYRRVYQGDRLAQLIIMTKHNVNNIIEVDELPTTERNQTGFGSTDK